MPDSQKLEKAELHELDADFKNEINTDKNCKVQFNPESLKVSFANQVATPSGAGDQKGTPARQFVGAGTTKLALTLWFDVSQPVPEGEEKVTDVRKLTAKVAYFITPKPEGTKFVPPAVRFIWGSFQFDGIMESMDESLEFFSSDGRPLRANVSLALTQQKITEFTFRATAGPNAPSTAGTRPLAQAPSGSNLQNMADKQGQGDNWQSIASANGIENPRMLAPGQLIDMSAGVSGGVGIGVSASVGVDVGVSASVGVSGGAGVSGTAGASIGGGVSLQGSASIGLG
ncbi:MAG TPA: hypothetical protein VGJ37_07090 [Pyrinomonadaceae bacterium]|jgi:hypothetical protein